MPSITKTAFPDLLSHAQTRSTSLILATVSATSSYPLFVAPFPCTIVGANIANWNTAIPQSDIDFWDVQFRRYRSASPVTIQTFSTRLSDGIEIPNRTGLSLSAFPVDSANGRLLTNDAIDMAFFKTGSPASWSVIQVTLHWKPTVA